MGAIRLFYLALTGRLDDVRSELSHYIRDVEAGGDRWWLSALLALDPFVAVELEEEGLDERVERFVRAFEEVPNDEPLTLRVMERTAAALRRIGRDALGARVEGLVADRQRVLAEGLRAGSEGS